MNRSSLIKAIGCLTAVSVVGCSSAAHSLGGDELQQKIDGNGGSTSTANSAGNGNSDAGVAAPPAPASETDPGSCGPCEDVTADYGAQSFRFTGCCLPSGKCGVDVGIAAQYVHANVPTSDGANTQVRLTPTSGCQPLDQVGVPDTSCPGMQFLNPNEFEGCCRPDGTCGANLGLIHAGCVQAQRELQPTGLFVDGGMPASPLPPQACNYPN